MTKHPDSVHSDKVFLENIAECFWIMP